MEYGIKMKKLIDKFSQGLLSPTDVASVVLFRVVFGLLMFWEITRYFYFGWVDEPLRQNPYRRTDPKANWLHNRVL